MATTICPQCGKDPGSHALVCPRCGARQPARGFLKAKPNSIEDPDVRRFRITLQALSVGAVLFVAAFAYRLNPILRTPPDDETTGATPITRVAEVSSNIPPASGDSSAPAVVPGERTARGTLAVNKVWEASEYAYALTTYTNTTSQTFNTLVEITCNVFNSKGQKVGTNHRSFTSYRTGPVPPGFTATKEIPVDMRWSGHMSSMKCAVTAAR